MCVCGGVNPDGGTVVVGGQVLNVLEEATDTSQLV